MSALLTFQESIGSEVQILRNFVTEADVICATIVNQPVETAVGAKEEINGGCL